MRHQPHHIARVAHDARDRAHRSVRAPVLVRVTRAVHVAQHDLAFTFKSIQRRLIRGVAAVAVSDRHREDLPLLVAVREERLRVLDAQPHRLADELEALVAQQRARKQVRFAGDLETVADAEHRPAAFRMRRYFGHDRTEAGDRAGTQVVAVAEAARQNDHVASGQVALLVPEIYRLFAELVHHGVIRVVIAVRAGEGDDAEFHDARTSATSKSSVTGLASSFSHIARASFSAADASRASSSSTTCRPPSTSSTALKPTVCSGSATALRWGSRISRRATMCSATPKELILLTMVRLLGYWRKLGRRFVFGGR